MANMNDKLNKLMTSPTHDCRLVIQQNFMGLLKGTLYVKSLMKSSNDEWSIAFEDETIDDLLKSLNDYLE